MGNSLFDQLKKSGLIDEKKAKQAKKEKHRQVKQQKGRKDKPPVESKLHAQQAQAEKVARNRELNQQRKQAAEEKAIAAQIKQIIQTNRMENTQGQVRYNFPDGGKVQLLYVTEKLQDQLAHGRVAIVKLQGGYELVPAEVVEKIKLRDSSCIILHNISRQESSDPDDPYAQYKVPDDLMW